MTAPTWLDEQDDDLRVRTPRERPQRRRLSLLRVLLTGLLFVSVLAVPTAPAQAAERPLVAVIGDSYTAGWGQVPGYGSRPEYEQSIAWWNFTRDNLGWRQGGVIANPGGGYLRPGMFGTIPESVERFITTISPDTDFVLIQAGLNDDGNPRDIPAQVARTIAAVKRQAPNAVPIIIGSFAPNATTLRYPNSLGVARYIGNYRAIGSERYMIAFMCEFDLDPDGLHPSELGQRQIGGYVSWHLQNGLDNGRPLRLDPTGTFWTV